MSIRALVAVGSVLLVSALLPAVAGASPYKVKILQAISGPSPFAAGCPGALHDDTNITGYELEPAITVNPANPRNIIAVWKQDVGPFNGTRSDLVASSGDGGKTWTRSTIPGLRICTGGTADSPPRPVGVGRRRWHRLLQRFSRRHFDRSADDRGRREPLEGRRAQLGRDRPRSLRLCRAMRRPAIVGSPTLAGHAYLVWANFIPSSRSRRARFSFLARPTAAGAGRPPSSSTSSRARSSRLRTPDPRPAERNAAGRLRPRRCRDRPRHAVCRALTRRGADVAASRGGRLQAASPSSTIPRLATCSRNRDLRARPSHRTAPSTSPSRPARRRPRARSACSGRATVVSHGAA